MLFYNQTQHNRQLATKSRRILNLPPLEGSIITNPDAGDGEPPVCGEAP